VVVRGKKYIAKCRKTGEGLRIYPQSLSKYFLLFNKIT
jgi:hypothetical protein